MNMLKIKLLLLSLFVFCVEQNNITASPYVALSNMKEKKEKSWREKIKKWSRKNWKTLSWIVGGLAVGGAAAFAHKKGLFGDENFSTGGNSVNSGSNNMFGGQFNGKNVFTKEEFERRAIHLFENEKFFVLAGFKLNLEKSKYEAGLILNNLSEELQKVREEEIYVRDMLKSNKISNERRKELESELKIIEKIKTEDDVRNITKQALKDEFDGIEKLEKIYKRYLGDAGSNKIFDQLLLFNLFKKNETFQANNDVFFNFHKNINNDYDEISNNIKSYAELAENYFFTLSGIGHFKDNPMLEKYAVKDKRLIDLMPLFNRVDSDPKKYFFAEEFKKFIGRVPQLVQEIIDEKEDITFEEGLRKKFVIFFNNFLENVDQMIKDRELAFEAQLEEEQRQEQERIRQKQLEDDNNKTGDKPQTFSSEKINEEPNNLNNQITDPVPSPLSDDKDGAIEPTGEKLPENDTSDFPQIKNDGKKDGDEPQSSSSEKKNEDFNDVNNKIVEPVELSLTGDKDEPVQTDKTSENDDDDDVNASAHLDQIGEGELSAHNSMSNKNEDNHKNEGDGHALSSPDVNEDDDEDVDGEEFYERSVR